LMKCQWLGTWALGLVVAHTSLLYGEGGVMGSWLSM
jgi:hypothetical protein